MQIQCMGEKQLYCGGLSPNEWQPIWMEQWTNEAYAFYYWNHSSTEFVISDNHFIKMRDKINSNNINRNH